MNLTNTIKELTGSDLSKYYELALNWTLSYIPKIIWAILVLWIWFKIIKIIDKWIKKIMHRESINPMLESFVTSLSSILLKIMVIIAAAGMLWVQTSSFIAMLAAAWFAIGMALSGTLQNFAGWVMILLLKPFKIWHFVEIAGFSWTVKEISIFNTILITTDRKRIIIPNSDISNWSMTNYSAEPVRRLDLVIWVSYSDDIDKVKEALLDISKMDERIIQEEDITIWLLELWESSVNFAFRFYVKKNDYWDVKFATLEKIKKEFDKRWINFPFPQRDVHIFNQK